MDDLRVLLGQLEPRRRRHSVAVAHKAAAAAHDLVDPSRLAEFITAATLHDIGYAPAFAHTGFHPIDGANALAKLGHTTLTRHLVATHTGARYEAATRGIDSAAFDPHLHPDDVRLEEPILAWADLTTGPDGQTVTVEERIAEILNRYPNDSPVARHIRTRTTYLKQAGSAPLGLHEVL